MKTKWWQISLVASAVLFICFPANGQENRVELAAESVEISLMLPAGLQPFLEQKMALVREEGVPAKFIFSDAANDVILAINTFGRNADEKGLSDVAAQIKATAEKQGSKVIWLTNDVIVMNGKRWLHLSFSGGAGVNELVNEYFVTDWAGKYVLFNFSLPTAKYESYKSTFERDARSVQLRLRAEATGLNTGTADQPRAKH
jgi:hypothetical protein